jgi:hypothetical protein
MINRSRSRLKLLMLVVITGYYMRLIRLPRQNHPERRKRGRRRNPRAIAPDRSVALTMTTKHTPIRTGYKRTRRPRERGRGGGWGCCYRSGRRRRWPITHSGSWRCGVEPRRWGEEEAVMVINVAVAVASTDKRLGLSLIERSR